MDKKENIFSNKFIDSALFFGVVTACLYFITYMYESMYLSFFYIPTKYFSISIDSVLNFIERFKLQIAVILLFCGIIIKNIIPVLDYRKNKLIKYEFSKPTLFWLILIFILTLISIFSFYSAIVTVCLFLYLLSLFFIKDKHYNFFIGVWFIYIVIAYSHLLNRDFYKIKKLSSVNIDNIEYVIINQSSEQLIIKKYLPEDTIISIADRKEFYVKQPKDEYEYSYVEFDK